MVFLKEDGSLDMERINKLPIEEYMKMIGELTDEQYHQHTKYISSISMNEDRKHTREIFVDYTMEDEIKKGTAVDLDEYLKRKRKELGLK